MGIKAQVSIAHKLGFTSHQNAVPLLRELILHNESEETFQDLTLHLRTVPAVLEEKNGISIACFPVLHLISEIGISNLMLNG